VNSFRLAFLNLSRRRISTAIAILSIAISVGCSGVLLRLYQLSGSRFATLAKGGEAIVGAKAGGIEILLSSLNFEGKFPGFLPIKLYSSLKQRQAVQFEDGGKSIPRYIRGLVPLLFFARYQGYRVVGTDVSFLKRPDAADNLTLATGRWVKGDGEIVVGSEVAETKHLKLGDRITVEGWVGDPHAGESLAALEVVGSLNPTSSTWDRGLYTSITQAQKVLDELELESISIWGSDVLNFFLVYLEPNGFSDLEALINRRTIGQTILVAEQKDRLAELTGTGRQLGLFMTILIMLVGSFAVMAMMVTRFEAMATQVAVLRALGYKKLIVVQWLLWEGLLLGVSACALGSLLDFCGFPWIRSLLGSALPQTVATPLLHSYPVWMGAIVATTFAVTVPIIRLYGQDVHSSLKGV
jgi:putative ABC transport system permease protein